MGINKDQPEFNTTIAISVQKFILKTKKFAEKSPNQQNL